MPRDDATDTDQPAVPWWRNLALGAALLAGVAVVAVLAGHDDRPQRPVNTVMRVVLPPPPPPPPPVRKEEKPPEPQKSTEPPKMTDPTPARQPAKAAPKAPGAALTAMAGAGTNAYGLAAGDGSGDMIGGGGGGGSQFGAYASQIQEALQRDEKTRTGHFLLTLRVWISAAGQVARAQIVSSSGDAATDETIIRVVSATPIGQRPPQDMPQPVTLRIRARAS